MRFSLLVILCSCEVVVSSAYSEEEMFWCRKNPGWNNDPEELAVFPFKKWDGSLKTFYKPYQEKGGSHMCVFNQTSRDTLTVGMNGVKLEDCVPCAGEDTIY